MIDFKKLLGRNKEVHTGAGFDGRELFKNEKCPPDEYRKLVYHAESDSVFEVHTIKDFKGAMNQGCDDVTDDRHFEKRFKRAVERNETNQA